MDPFVQFKDNKPRNHPSSPLGALFVDDGGIRPYFTRPYFNLSVISWKS